MKLPRDRLRDSAPYIAGVGLVHLGCFLGGTGFSTVLGEKIVNGLFWGTLLSVVFVPANFLIQFLVRRVFMRFFEWYGERETFLLCLPAAAFVLYILSGAILSRPAEGIFKEDIAVPIPSSVKIVNYGYLMSIGSGSWGSLKFEIALRLD